MRPRNDGGPNAQPQPPEASNVPTCFHPLPEYTTHNARTCINHLFPYSATSKLSHKVSPPAYIRKLNATPHTRKPRSEMRSQVARGPGALPRHHVDRQGTSPSSIQPVKTRGHAETNRGRERDNGKRQRARRTTGCAHCTILTGRLHPSPKIPTSIECTLRT